MVRTPLASAGLGSDHHAAVATLASRAGICVPIRSSAVACSGEALPRAAHLPAELAE
jgi:hypothetical protein